MKNYFSRNSIFDYFIILAFGLAIFLFFYLRNSPKLGADDEIIYAVMGRNIATGRGIITNFYHPLWIIEKGYPLQDVHMPGYSFILALSFRLLGEVEYAAFAPNYLSYLVGGLLLFWVGKNLFNRWAGYSSALFFYLFPSVVTFTYIALADMTLTLLSITYFVIWYQSLVRPKWPYSVLLAILLVAGLIHRETSVVFLPPTLYVLWVWPKQARWKASLFFGATFILLFVLIFLPLYLDRFKMASSTPLDQYIRYTENANFDSAVTYSINRIKNNLLSTISFELDNWQRLIYQLQFLLTASIVLIYHRFSKVQKIVTIYTLVIFVTMFIGLVWLYPLGGWAKGRAAYTRLILYLIPPVLVLIGGFLSTLNSKWLKYTLNLAIISFFFFGSLSLNDEIRQRIWGEYNRDRLYTDIVYKHIGQFQPKTIMAHRLYLYGWEHFPTTIIWELEGVNLELARQLARKVTIDAIIAPNAYERDRVIAAIEQGTFTTQYKLVAEDQGYYFFLNSNLMQP